MVKSRVRTLTNPPATAVRAAMYVRMSTDGQNYSIDHQRAEIYEYAAAFKLDIVREYADEGKSGLDIKGRVGLRSLMSDVLAGTTDFSVIVVYDVSRWGRFQDVDEAAYYEYTCRRAGIQVCYCAEQFQNDGSPLSSLLKSIKRTMAAEYSRELSAKVFNAQCRFVKLGFKQGGSAGYGLRRLALTDEGVPRRILAYNERKSALTDRVILVLGPDAEVALVRRIYSLYLQYNMGDAGIARLLNNENVDSEFGGPWTCYLVATILTNRKYVGALVYNKRSSKLMVLGGRNHSDTWIVNDQAFEGLIDPTIFKKAQAERLRRSQPIEAEVLLGMLRACYETHGKVTQNLIEAIDYLPDPEVFARCFGSLVEAYRQAGIPCTQSFRFIETRRAVDVIRQATFAKVCSLIGIAGATFACDDAPFVITINGSVRVRIEVATSRFRKHEPPFWKVCHYPGVDFILTARLDQENRVVLDFFLIPTNELAAGYIYMRPRKPIFDRVRHLTLESIFGLPESISSAGM
jgi:DNA invertase Pin-like site-specific DNA recombinase